MSDDIDYIKMGNEQTQEKGKLHLLTPDGCVTNTQILTMLAITVLIQMRLYLYYYELFRVRPIVSAQKVPFKYKLIPGSFRD